jgi:hypothetical protein
MLSLAEVRNVNVHMAFEHCVIVVPIVETPITDPDELVEIADEAVRHDGITMPDSCQEAWIEEW